MSRCRHFDAPKSVAVLYAPSALADMPRMLALLCAAHHVSSATCCVQSACDERAYACRVQPPDSPPRNARMMRTTATGRYRRLSPREDTPSAPPLISRLRRDRCAAAVSRARVQMRGKEWRRADMRVLHGLRRRLPVRQPAFAVAFLCRCVVRAAGVTVLR